MNKKKRLVAAVYTCTGLMTAFFISWCILAQMNFLYGFWHDHAGIGAGIEEYGPQNRYREGFADTTREERIRLFGQINRAIHHSGDGLADIRYRTPSTASPQPLLREPEIGHLQDVANLIDVLKWIAGLAVLAWLGCIAWTLVRRWPLPSLRRQMVGILASVATLALLVLLIGPERVFNQLHIWIFPPEHPWFFYYQDSLMSTMMMAPRLFAWVTVVWVPFALLWFFALQAAVAIMSTKRQPPLAQPPIGREAKPRNTARKKKTRKRR